MNDIAFQPFKIKKLEIKNRFIMSAAVDGLDNDLDVRIQRYKKLAEGDIGLIIAGRIIDKQESFKTVVETVHDNGGRIALQILSHKGLGFNPELDLPAPSVVREDSPIFSKVFPFGKHHEASEAEIEDLIEDYAKAARIAKDLGVDAVEVHSAHNSALMQFLTPLINQREDKWGDSVENRIRIHKKVYDAIRSEIGEEMPVIIKLGVKDPFRNGLSLEEGKTAAKLLAEYGYDALEISQGLQDFRDTKGWKGTPIRIGTLQISQEGYFREWCKEIKKVINKPVILTGGLRSYELINEILANNEANLVGMCRPFIREPSLIKRWRKGERKKATCISCNKCCIGMMKNLPLVCYIKEKWGISSLYL